MKKDFNVAVLVCIIFLSFAMVVTMTVLQDYGYRLKHLETECKV